MDWKPGMPVMLYGADDWGSDEEEEEEEEKTHTCFPLIITFTILYIVFNNLP